MDLNGPSYGIKPWVSPSTWTHDAAPNAALYSSTSARTYIAPTLVAANEDAGVQMEYTAATAATGAVGWGRPEASTANLLVVFRK